MEKLTSEIEKTIKFMERASALSLVGTHTSENTEMEKLKVKGNIFGVKNHKENTNYI